MNMDRIRKGGGVRRYHTRPVIGEQTVAAHSWGVAALVLELMGGEPWDRVGPVLRAALYHDVAEYDTGDTPATAKWASQSLKSALDELENAIEVELGISAKGLDHHQIAALKAADMLELMWFCLEQRRMGNTTLDEVWENGDRFLEDFAGRIGGYRALAQAFARLRRELRDHRDALFPGEPSSA